MFATVASTSRFVGTITVCVTTQAAFQLHNESCICVLDLRAPT